MKNGKVQRYDGGGKNGAKSKNSACGKFSTKMRVTGGNLRGREFLSPQAPGTHPMGAREKIALFNMLTGELTGARVLDAYAGSGALGIEALSRGALEAVFVEKNTGVARILKKNLRDLGLEKAETEDAEGRVAEGGVAETKITEVEVMGVREFIKKNAEQRFDIILVDPPYDNFDITEVNLLTKLLKDGGIMILSHPEVEQEAAGVAPSLAGMEPVKNKKYARARISIYRRIEVTNRDVEQDKIDNFSIS